jgi:hypothetical protein
MHRLGAWTTTVLLGVIVCAALVACSGVRYRRFAMFWRVGCWCNIARGFQCVVQSAACRGSGAQCDGVAVAADNGVAGI